MDDKAKIMIAVIAFVIMLVGGVGTIFLGWPGDVTWSTVAVILFSIIVLLTPSRPS